MGVRSSCAHVWVEVPLAEAGSREGLFLTLCLWLTSQPVVEGAGVRVWEPRLRYVGTCRRQRSPILADWEAAGSCWRREQSGSGSPVSPNPSSF